MRELIRCTCYRAVHTFRLVHVMLFISSMAFLGARPPATPNLSPAHALGPSAVPARFLPLFLSRALLRRSGAWLRACAGATRSVYGIYSERPEGPQFDTPNATMLCLGKRWRSERNFWISFFNFTMWM